jgi:hypothetical protein
VKVKKLIRTLIVVSVSILIIQSFLAISVLILCGSPNSTVGTIASFSIMASITVLAFLLGSLFKLYTVINFGKIDYKVSFDKSDRNEKKLE